MGEPVGKLTRSLITEFYEKPCGSSDTHRAHLIAVHAGGGGGHGEVFVRGEMSRPPMVTHEYWCPGK